MDIWEIKKLILSTPFNKLTIYSIFIFTIVQNFVIKVQKSSSLQCMWAN